MDKRTARRRKVRMAPDFDAPMALVDEHLIDAVAISAATVLVKYGMGNPDWTEWRTLKDDLLKLHPHLTGHAKNKVGHACSTFNEELAKLKAKLNIQ